MTFLALHRGRHTSLATDQLWLSADELSQTADARALLQRLEQHWAHCEAEHRQALDEARVAGHAQGRAEALAQVAPRLIDAWDHAARSAQADVQAVREMVATLAIQVADRVARGLAPAEVVSALARRASEDLLPDTTAVVRVHPDVADAVRARLGAPRADGAAVLDVRGDVALEPLDCVFETPAGTLLVGLHDQLAQVMRGWTREGAMGAPA